ncbi:MAG: DUF814 domain-containing protein [Cyclobacteriaceae bacterium]|nr:DUF814 domain-containing protein [Cyclobacteriaceae bacterium]
MHNNYYLIKPLSEQLHSLLNGFSLVSCFSQNKDELVFEFNNAHTSFFLKASLQPSLCCLSFPSTFHRAKKNSIDLFDEIILKKVITIHSFSNERSFSIEFEDDWSLLFKMHGYQSNVIALHQNKAVKIFRNQFSDDLTVQPEQLHRTIVHNKEIFEEHLGDLSKHYVTLGKEVILYLQHHFNQLASLDEKWSFFQQTISELENPSYRITEGKGKIHLSLIPGEKVISTQASPIEALNEFYHLHTSTDSFQHEKHQLLKSYSDSLKRMESYIAKNKIKLNEIVNDKHYQVWADLIMAHMHEIKIGTEKITLENFYTGQPEEIKLKKELNAQQNAEVFYRKAKNQQIEINQLSQSIDTKKKEIEKIKALIDQITEAPDLKSLRPFIRSKPVAKAQQESASLPYHEFTFKGFRIWVGKNAEANDELTLKFSFKEDLWLHAKDVAGSHVLIKHQSGKPFPKDVIERAAELAAYNSKRKTDSLCPVAYTPKKFVRKRKGDPGGAVVVEKESVILVQPKLSE